MADDLSTFEEYTILGTNPGLPVGHVMTVKLSQEMLEMLEARAFTQLRLVIGNATTGDRILVDDKSYDFRASAEDKPHECFCLDPDTGTLNEVGQVKRKLLAVGRELTQQNRDAIKSSADLAERERKKHKSIQLDGSVGPKGKTTRVAQTRKPATSSTAITKTKSLLTAAKLPRTKSTTITPPTVPPPVPKVTPAPLKVSPPTPSPPTSSPKPPSPSSPYATPSPGSTPSPSSSFPSHTTPPIQPPPAPSLTNTSRTPTKTRPARVAASTTPMPVGMSPAEQRAAIVHALALKEQGTNRFPKDATKVLQSVAEFKAPGIWFLKEDFYKEVKVDTWDAYSPEDREKVRSRVTPVLAKQAAASVATVAADDTTKPSKTRPSTAEAVVTAAPTPKSARVGLLPTPTTTTAAVASTSSARLQHPAGRPAPKTNTPTGTAPAPPVANGDHSSRRRAAPPATAPAPASSTGASSTSRAPEGVRPSSEKIVAPPIHKDPIVNSGMYDAYKHEYNSKYSRYKQLNEDLNTNRTMFAKLGEEWRAAEDAVVKKQLSANIEKLYQNDKERIFQMQTEYSTLHQELKAVKTRMQEYAEMVKTKKASTRTT
eukprot:TRINITY_DN1951_c0_g1_i3.p1 TRINITY_DN1951_c0_g1~~TRINITY_DN1951_c0_g1_i3.p1  ORF type:complete len:599 (+),score=144.56 TRINITY_DN1951_c0_g1_i3:163-1959(+)